MLTFIISMFTSNRTLAHGVISKKEMSYGTIFSLMHSDVLILCDMYAPKNLGVRRLCVAQNGAVSYLYRDGVSNDD